MKKTARILAAAIASAALMAPVPVAAGICTQEQPGVSYSIRKTESGGTETKTVTVKRVRLKKAAKKTYGTVKKSGAVRWDADTNRTVSSCVVTETTWVKGSRWKTVKVTTTTITEGAALGLQ